MLGLELRVGIFLIRVRGALAQCCLGGEPLYI